MSYRRLRVRKETLAELSGDEMRALAGGNENPLSNKVCIVIQQTLIPTCDCTGYYPSINAPCFSKEVCVETS